MSTAHPSAVGRPLRPRILAWTFLASLALAAFWLPWNFEFLASASERERSRTSLVALVQAALHFDTSPATLQLGARLALETLATASLGTLLGAMGGFVLALGASRAVWDLPRAYSRQHWPMRAALEGFRVVLDILRGIPDFAWALILLAGPGPGSVTGILALGLSIAGILGKIYSELWDALEEKRYAILPASGASRLTTFLYGIQPQTGKAMLSYTLMRAECAVRNASVIGVVGGGGLGGELFDQFHFGRYSSAATLLLILFALTAATDLVSGVIRGRLRFGSEGGARDKDERTMHPGARSAAGAARADLRRRVAVVGAVALCLGAFAFSQRSAWSRAARELSYIEWPWIRDQLSRLASPDLSARTLGQALGGALLPLLLGLLCTACAVLLAGLAAYPMSSRFQLRSRQFTIESASALRRVWRGCVYAVARTTALVARATPEVAWLLVFAAVTRAGILPAFLALTLHSFGVLARVFTEAIDDVPARYLESHFAGPRGATFLYAAIPHSLRPWTAYAAFQLEVNVRAGVVLGIVGAGGLGDRFHTSISFWSLERASTFALAMVLLTLLLDRGARALRLAQVDSRT